MKDPLILWNELNDRFDHHNTIFLPKARFNWLHLRLQDFKTIAEITPPYLEFVLN